MPAEGRSVEAVIIGGGFYGAVIAAFLARLHPGWRVLLVEREGGLMGRASFHNQARVHSGYHYPRSFTTAFRSRVNLPRFVREWSDSILTQVTNLYGIARSRSKITARQFERACAAAGADLIAAPRAMAQLFDARLVEAVYRVNEHIFDSTKLARAASQSLEKAGVSVETHTEVTAVYGGARSDRAHLRLICQDRQTQQEKNICAPFVFNCTYSNLNHLGGQFRPLETLLKHEITEMALLEVPPHLQSTGITLMDGPFFSLLPFPARRLHTLSHVRYTPHCAFADTRGTSPYSRLENYARHSRSERMLRDARRYIPSLRGARYVDSLFEVKTVLTQNESDDGRPILLHQNPNLAGFYSVLGGKIDNVYDVLEMLPRCVTLPTPKRRPLSSRMKDTLHV